MEITFTNHLRRQYLCSDSIHVLLQEGLVHSGKYLCEQSSHLCSVLAHWDQWRAAPCEKDGTQMYKENKSVRLGYLALP